MTIITSKDGAATLPAGDLLNAVFRASDKALRDNDVPKALRLINDYVDRTPNIPEASKEELKSRLEWAMVKASPNNILLAECHVSLGRLYQKVKNIGAAIAELIEAQTLDPRNGCAALYLGIIYQSNIKYGKAQKNYDHAIEINQKAPSEKNRSCADQAAKNLEVVRDLLARKLLFINGGQ